MKLLGGMNTPEAARIVLPAQAKKFFKRGRKAFRKGDAETLHEFRVEAKRFRYALEIFQPLYGPRFASKLQMLKKLQDLLGRLNDLATTRTLLHELPGAEVMTEFLDQGNSDVRAKLEKYWTEQMDAPGSEDRWVRYLTQYAGQTGSTRLQEVIPEPK